MDLSRAYCVGVYSALCKTSPLISNSSHSSDSPSLVSFTELIFSFMLSLLFIDNTKKKKRKEVDVCLSNYSAQGFWSPTPDCILSTEKEIRCERIFSFYFIFGQYQRVLKSWLNSFSFQILYKGFMMSKDWTLNGSQLTLTLNSAEVWKIGPVSRLKTGSSCLLHAICSVACTLRIAGCSKAGRIYKELIVEIMKEHKKRLFSPVL